MRTEYSIVEFFRQMTDYIGLLELLIIRRTAFVSITYDQS